MHIPSREEPGAQISEKRYQIFGHMIIIIILKKVFFAS